MKYIDVENWNRFKTYSWFKTFSNSTYGFNTSIDVTELVKYSRETKTSFFVNMLYIVVSALNSVEEMRMRMLDGKPCVFEDINPAYTVMSDAGTFENVRHKNYKEYKKFYEVAKAEVESAKRETSIKKEDYNPKNVVDEYYITCVPWVGFNSITHPIPDNIESQCIPRICWGKFEEIDGRYKMGFNITVSHLFIDGYHLSQVLLKLQSMLDQASEVLK